MLKLIQAWNGWININSIISGKLPFHKGYYCLTRWCQNLGPMPNHGILMICIATRHLGEFRA